MKTDIQGGNFTVMYKSDSVRITSPQMTRKQAVEFIAAVGVKKILEIKQDGKLVDSDTTSSIIREAKAI